MLSMVARRTEDGSQTHLPPKCCVHNLGERGNRMQSDWFRHLGFRHYILQLRNAVIQRVSSSTAVRLHRSVASPLVIIENVWRRT